MPREVLQKLAKRLRAHDGPIGLGIRPGTASSCNPGVIGLTVGDMALTVRPTEGEAPAFDRMFRNDVHASITIDRADMVRATKKADAIGRAQGNTGPLAIRWDENGAMAVAPPSDAENRHRVRGMKVPTTTEDGTPGTPNGQLLHLNPRFLLDLLSTFDGNTVTMHLHAPREEHPTEVTKTVLFTNGPDPRGDGYRHLLQPVQLH